MNELLALVETNHPDLVCVTETWLNANITNEEIATIPGYTVYRHDRDRQGGCVILYIQDIYITTQLPPPPMDLELLPIILQHTSVPGRICVLVFYWPPSSNSKVLEDLSTYLDYIVSSQFTKLVVVGDFN